MMKQLHQLLFIGSACRGIRVVELGSGCGVAGIALAQIVAGTSVLLTDLEEAQDIISHNIKSTRLPRGSSLQQEVLDWDKPLSLDESHHSVDLLIICECIYNADSCPTLIRVIQQFIRLSPTMKTLVITKKRHDSERVFFDLMAKAGIQMLEQCFVPLPHIVTDLDHERQQAEIYLFGADLDVMSSIEPFRLEPPSAHPGPLYPGLGNLNTNQEPANTVPEPLNTNSNPPIPGLGHLNTNDEPRPDNRGPPARLKAKVRRRKSRKSE
jgi:predicted nicotinamide N-methyase